MILKQETENSKIYLYNVGNKKNKAFYVYLLHTYKKRQYSYLQCC